MSHYLTIHQISTQWDGFRHYGYQNLKVFYNGATAEDFSGSAKLGMHGMRARCFFDYLRHETDSNQLGVRKELLVVECCLTIFIGASLKANNSSC